MLIWGFITSGSGVSRGVGFGVVVVGRMGTRMVVSEVVVGMDWVGK